MYNDQNTLNLETSPWLIECTHHPKTTTMLEVPSFIEKKKNFISIIVITCFFFPFFSLPLVRLCRAPWESSDPSNHRF